VLARLGDRITSEQVLPWGARVRELVNNFPALSEYGFGDLEPGFFARARQARGGFLVAGAEFGMGEAWDTAALVMVELGVRAVLARSIAPGFDRLLALAGVLPLAWAGSDDGSAVKEGDELEFPGVPETLIADRPLVVRNLTRGTQYTLRHDLSDRDVRRLRRGGLLTELATR
jgi:aconitate hydratase